MTFDSIFECLKYDAETGCFTWLKSRGNLHIKGVVAGSLDKDGYIQIGFNGRQYRAARLAWFFVHREWPKEQVDHINRVRTDNRIANLRSVSLAENSKNKGIFRRSITIAPKGVYLKRDVARSKPWFAAPMINGVKKHLGHFETAELAAAAIQTAMRTVLFQHRDSAQQTSDVV